MHFWPLSNVGTKKFPRLVIQKIVPIRHLVFFSLLPLPLAQLEPTVGLMSHSSHFGSKEKKMFKSFKMLTAWISRRARAPTLKVRRELFVPFTEHTALFNKKKFLSSFQKSTLWWWFLISTQNFLSYHFNDTFDEHYFGGE